MIRDKYTFEPISRQRKYQLRMRDKKCCITCGKKAITSHYCEEHAQMARDLSKKHYLNSVVE